MFTRHPNDLPTEAYKNIPLRELQIADAMFEQINAKSESITQVRLHNNMSTNYRGAKDETLLFVNCEPLSLRLADDTATSVWWDASSGQHHIGELPALGQPPESLQLYTQHPTCLPCRDLLAAYCHCQNPDKDDNVKDEINAVIWHHSISSLVVSATHHNCFICSVILNNYLWTRYSSLLKAAAGLEGFRVEVCWDFEGNEKANGKRNLYFAAIDKGKRKHTSSNYFFLAVMCAWPEEADFAFQSHGKDLDCDEDDRRKQLALSWVEDCNSNESGHHSACARGSDDSFIPSRVLDVEGSVRDGKLRLVCRDDGKGQVTRYCTLSHCWGKKGSEIIPLLQEGNLNERCKDGIAIGELPSAFRDAVAVCHWFQAKYLWIDSLCIIQDSKEDWQKEAQQMSRIYKAAWLNISADAGEDSQVGLFRDITLLNRTWPQFSSSKSNHCWRLTPSKDYFLQTIETAPSWSRAWIHRERQLSRRILKFTRHGMAWECCKLGRPSYASESFPGGVPFEHFFEAENKYQIGRMEQELLPHDEETYARWNDVCEVLSTKDLTYESDRWLILSTMAEDFSKLLPDDNYLAGLWGSTMPHSLLWHHRYPRKPPTVSWNELGPSWSWLSGRRPVTLAHRAHVKRHAVVAELKIAVAAPAAPETPLLAFDPFGRVREGGIGMIGYLRPMRLRLDYDAQTWHIYVLEQNLVTREESPKSLRRGMRKLFKGSKSDESNSSGKKPAKPTANAWRYIGESYNSTEGDLCDVHADWQDIPDPYDCFVLFITLDQASNSRDSSSRDIEGLILERANAKHQPGDNIFNRYGKISFADELAVKMRYQVSSKEHFDGFNGVTTSITPQKYIQQFQLQRAREQKGEDGLTDAKRHGVDGLYSFDGDVEQIFPWLKKLEPTVLQIV